MIRKLVTIVEETHREAGRRSRPPTRKAAAIAVIANPFAGRYVDDLEPLMAIGESSAACSANAPCAALGVRPGRRSRATARRRSSARTASWSMPPPSCTRSFGAPLRAAVEKGAALVPSAKKRGGLGTPIDVPLGHKDAAFVRSHFDAMEVRVPDAPRRDEIVVAVVVTDSGRPLPRIGGLTVDADRGQGRAALTCRSRCASFAAIRVCLPRS